MKIGIWGAFGSPKAPVAWERAPGAAAAFIREKYTASRKESTEHAHTRAYNRQGQETQTNKLTNYLVI